MDLKSLHLAVQQIAADKGISAERVVDAIESAIAAAYKKEYRKKGEIIRCKLDTDSGDLKFWQIKIVVDPGKVKNEEKEKDGEGLAENSISEKKRKDQTEEINFKERGKEQIESDEKLFHPNLDHHIFLGDAKKIKKNVQDGEELKFPLEVFEEFGRIAAQTTKQVILQNLREAERASIREEFAGKEGEIVSGVVQRIEKGNVYMDLGRAAGVIFKMETVPGEHYKVGDRYRSYVLGVQEDAYRPNIILSRAHPKFVEKLFALEVPEIADGTVKIKAVAREPGSRTKIAVWSEEEGIDPIGSAIGQRGTRVMAVTSELNNEKIDLVEWSNDPAKYVANALSPAKVKLVEILPRRGIKALVAEDQLSLAIGKGGQNVRLAARLTGWKIDVRSQSRPEEVQEGGVASAESGEEAEEKKGAEVEE